MDQSITNDHSQSRDHTVIHIVSVAKDALPGRESREMEIIKWALLLSSFILEGLSLAFDQLSTPKEPIYALMSMITASLGLLISIIELSDRFRANYKTIWRLLGHALENFGFFVSTWQFIYAVLQYVYIYKKKINNPIKISLLPLILFISVTISKLYNYICAERIESSMDASTTTTLSKDDGPVSLSNAGAIETQPVVPDEPEVLIRSKKSRDDTGIHKRAFSSRKKINEQIKGQLGSISSSDNQQQTAGNSQIYEMSRQSDSGVGPYSPFGSGPGSVSLGFYALQRDALQRENVFPERPGQGECLFYMKTGDCKFGAVCRFHHPRERLIPAPDCVLSPIGLPLRPGEPVCILYSRCGICKFGRSCKFDHPMGGIVGIIIVIFCTCFLFKLSRS